MKKRLAILLVFFAVSTEPAFSQQLSIEQMIRMTGGNQAYLPALQAQYDTRGLQTIVRAPSSPAAVFGFAGAGGETSGDSGDFGNNTSGSYILANQNNGLSDYSGRTAKESPYSRGGLPDTNMAIQSTEGGFGQQFGYTEIPSGRHKYGFTKNPEPTSYRGVSGNMSSRGRMLPPVSTSSVDINIVDKGPARGDWERQVYTPSYEAVMAIRRAKARGFFPKPQRFGR